jgi:hypothetical protein
VEKIHPTDIEHDNINEYNSDSERITEYHGTAPTSHTVDTRPDPHPPVNHTTRTDRPGRHTTRPRHGTARGRRNTSVTIQHIETHPMTAADEKEAIDALAALLAHHQRDATSNPAHKLGQPAQIPARPDHPNGREPFRP